MRAIEKRLGEQAERAYAILRVVSGLLLAFHGPHNGAQLALLLAVFAGAALIRRRRPRL